MLANNSKMSGIYIFFHAKIKTYHNIPFLIGWAAFLHLTEQKSVLVSRRTYFTLLHEPLEKCAQPRSTQGRQSESRLSLCEKPLHITTPLNGSTNHQRSLTEKHYFSTQTVTFLKSELAKN